MTPVAFEPRSLPDEVARAIRGRLVGEHRREPFSALDARATVHRVEALVTDLGVRTVVYRGGLDLRGSEVDHIWLAIEPLSPQPRTRTGPYVVDAAFPLFEDTFVTMLRRFVAGDASATELSAVAEVAGVDARVIGEFPAPLRYLGQPVWSSRS